MAHVWRVFAEGTHLAKEPFFVAITLMSCGTGALGLASPRGAGEIKRCDDLRPINRATTDELARQRAAALVRGTRRRLTRC